MHFTLPVVATFAGIALAAPQVVRPGNRQPQIQAAVIPTDFDDGSDYISPSPVNAGPQQQPRYFRDGKPISRIASEVNSPAASNQIDTSKAWAGGVPPGQVEETYLAQAQSAYSPPEYDFRISQGQTGPQELNFQQSPSQQLPDGQLPNGEIQLDPQIQDMNIPTNPRFSSPSPQGVQNPNGLGSQIPNGPGSQIPNGPGSQLPNGAGTQLPNGPGSQIPNGAGTQNPNAPFGQPNGGSNTQPRPGTMRLPNSDIEVPIVQYDKTCPMCLQLETQVYNTCFKRIPISGDSGIFTVKNCYLQRAAALQNCDRMCAVAKNRREESLG